MSALSADVQEEIAALEAIFGDDFKRLPGGDQVRFSIRLGATAEEFDGAVLCFTLPRGYPGSAVRVACTFGEGEAMTTTAHSRVSRSVEEKAERLANEMRGRTCCFDIASAAREWTKEALGSVSCSKAVGEEDDEEDDGDEEKEDGKKAAKKKKEPKWWDAEVDGEGEAAEAATARMVAEATNAAAVKEAAMVVQVARSAAASAKRKKHGFGATAEWRFVVGLIGKPSSGKSTFFNAACGLLNGLPEAAFAQQSRMASMAAHPFTTIKPNFGNAFAAVPCPCNGDPACAAPWGHCAVSSAGAPTRLVPVAIKDVAGLVPGAYRGRGKGNRFLDDLLDADVLVHIVDVSGETDAEGRSDPSACSNPADDVGWIRSELHRWIFDNVRAKWGPVRRRPDKLPTLFSGYHASKSFVRAALVRAGVDPGTMVMTVTAADGSPSLLSIQDWGPEHLHRVVANFLRTRFPILLAMNKADSDSAIEHGNVKRVRAAWPTEPAVPVSARGELLLQQLRARGAVSYLQGASSFVLPSPVPQEKFMEAAFAAGFRSESDESKPVSGTDVVAAALAALAKNVMKPFGSTGVIAALTQAMALRPPSVAFPVADLATRVSHVPFQGGTDLKGAPGPLRDCVLLKPGASVGDLCDVLKHEPWHLLAGEFVHAESVSSFELTRRTAVHKDDPVTPENSVINISMTRRAI